MIRSKNLIPNYTDNSLYFKLRPNQTCQTSQKQPTVQNKKYVHNIKYVSPEDLKLFFKCFSNVMYTQIFLKANSWFNAAIADVYTISVPV